MDKVFVAKRVTEKLHATENSVDAALVEASEMMAELLRARKDLNLAATVGDDAVAQVTAAIAALSQARSAMVAAHGELGELALRMNIRTRMDIQKLAAEPATRQVA